MFHFVREDHQTGRAGKKIAINAGEPIRSSRVHANTSEETWKTSHCLSPREKIKESDKGKGKTDMGSWHRTEQEGSGNDRPKACFHGWLAGWQGHQERSTKKNKENKTPDHSKTAQRKSQDHHDDKKTTQNTSRRGKERRGISVSFLVLPGRTVSQPDWLTSPI